MGAGVSAGKNQLSDATQEALDALPHEVQQELEALLTPQLTSRLCAPAAAAVAEETSPSAAPAREPDPVAATVVAEEKAPSVAPARATDEEIVTLRKLTPEQEAANAKAAAHITEVAAKADAAPEAEREPATFEPNHPLDGKPRWDISDGALIEDALDHTPLVDLEYVVALGRAGGVLPCGLQNVPPAAPPVSRHCDVP